MKKVKLFEQFITEANRATVHSSAKKASYPVTLVAIEKGKVVDQKLVGTPMIVPAAFNMMQKEFPNAKINIESKTGQIVFSESVVNEGKGAYNYFDDLKYNYTKSLRHLDKDEKKEYNKLAKDFFSKISESVDADDLTNEKREDVGRYNTVKKVVAKLGRRPSEQDLATFINNNYYDVTEVERGDDDPQANDKIADLVSFYKFDIDDWEIAWSDAQNESVVTEGKTSAVYTDPKTGKGYDLQYVSTKKRWELDVMKKGASIYSSAITTIKRDTLAEIQEWLDGYNIDSSWTKGLSEAVVTEARPGTKTYYHDRDVLPPHYGNSELHDKSEEMFKKSWKKLNDKQKDEVLSSFPKNESVVAEAKIKYSKGKTYQSDGHWTVYVDSNSSGFDIRVNHSAGWRLDPQDVREETIQLLDNGRQRATLNFKSGNIDKFAQQMFDLNDRTSNGNQTKLTAKDYADIIRVWIDMKKANESVSSQNEAVKVTPESDVKIDDYTSDNGEEIKAVEIVGAISSSETEEEFLDYFYDAYGQGAFTETDTSTLVKYFNDYLEEVTAKETEEEEEAKKAEGGDEEDPLADL